MSPRSVTRESILQFADLTGDHSPVHTDRDYALAMGLKDNFAHGLLGACWATGWLSQLHHNTGNAATPPTAIEFNFATPVFCNDELSLQLVEDASKQGDGSNNTATLVFALFNQQQQPTGHGNVSFRPLENSTAIEKLDPGEFIPVAGKTYFANDMYENGPRGSCACHQFSTEEVDSYLQYSGEHREAYLGSSDKPVTVPPVFVFCRAFSSWLEQFLQVQTPDAGFPGHIKDTFAQHLPVAIGDTLSICHQVTDYRASKSRPEMALITITLQVLNQRDDVVQSGSILLMMPTQQ